MRHTLSATVCLLGLLLGGTALAQDNQLSPQEKSAGWMLLFDGKSADGWKLPNGKPFPDKNIEDAVLKPYKAGGGWSYYDKKFGDCVFACDFKVSKGCNSGLFFRVQDPKDPVYTGLEMQVFDSAAKDKPGTHDCGAVYDILPPKVNAMKPAGAWNHVELTARGPNLDITMNGQHIISMDLSKWTEPGKNPDGSKHKFGKLVLADLASLGYIGFQDHGHEVWYKNIKIKPLTGAASGNSSAAPRVRESFTSATAGGKKRLLLITESKGFVHPVVNRKGADLCLVEKTFIDMGEKSGLFDVVCSQDSRADLTAENLKNFDAVWFYTTGSLPLSDTQKADLLNFVRKGGGFGGSHSATDTFYNWPEYGQLIGGYFDGHPWHTKVNVIVEDTDHPATRHLGKSFEITDEIYQFKAPFSRDRLHVLMWLEPEFVRTSIIKEKQRVEEEKQKLPQEIAKAREAGNKEQVAKLEKRLKNLESSGSAIHRDPTDHPLAWTNTFGKGRVFYTALGHREEVWQDPRYQQHVIGGLRYLFGMEDGAALKE